jgi:hypothetical protein
MNRKRIAVMASGAMLMVSGWLPLGATITIAGGGVATIGGCSDSRQDARTEARTDARATERVDNRHD